MNRVFVRQGSPAQLVIDVWDSDTQRRITERDLMDLFDSERHLDGGRFENHRADPLEHTVMLPYRDYSAMRHGLPTLIEWIAHNAENGWNLSFDDPLDYYMGNSFPKLQPIFSFEDVGDAVLFKLRWI